MSDSVFNVVLPKVSPVAVVVSSPHSGVKFPKEVAAEFKPKFIEHPEDTDWFVDRLYDFVTDLGAVLIKANYSRYVIDLNRHPGSQRLYDDSRTETELVPSRSFSGEPLYQDRAPTMEEIERRRSLYYEPYYEKISSLISELRANFQNVLFFDAHSIKHQVTSIQSEPFPDLILSDQCGTKAAPKLFDAIYSVLEDSRFQVSNNHPFRGGQLTRSFGDPSKGVHAIQLEMSQKNYMDESTTRYRDDLAGDMQDLLRLAISAGIKALEEL